MISNTVLQIYAKGGYNMFNIKVSIIPTVKAAGKKWINFSSEGKCL